MAKEVLKNAFVEINSVDLSDHVQSITLPITCEEIDKTCMGDDSKARLPGLKDASLDITWAQDFASDKVDATLWAVYNGDAAVTINVKKDTGATAATNPEYSFSAILTNYTPIDATVGELSKASSTFVCDGDVTRSTS